MVLEGTAELASEEDLGIARRIAERDQRAFESLMRAHNRLLYRVARSILKDDDEAEDAVQEAYLAAFRNIGSFRGGAKLSTWLTRIVINEAYARLRKQKQSGIVVSLESARTATAHGEQRPEEGVMSDQSTEHPENATLRAELRQLLEARIDALPEQFRTVFILRDVEEMSVEETAACLDLPAATVRTRAFRARALLRESLSRDIDVATANAFEFAGKRCDRIVSSVLNRVSATASGGSPELPA